MSSAVLKTRVSSLEKTFESYLLQSSKVMLKMELDSSSFKSEMLEFKDEMRDFKNEMLEFKNEMSDFKIEMQAFKVEMQDFKDETKQDRKKMNKQWGDLANKMGTIVEDIISPGVGPTVKQYFKEELLEKSIHHKRKLKAEKLEGEFDVIGISETSVYLVEVKSSPTLEKLRDFKARTIPRFQQLFPEFTHKRLVPIFAALRFDKKLESVANKAGIYLLAYREWEYLDILNFEEVQKNDSPS